MEAFKNQSILYDLDIIGNLNGDKIVRYIVIEGTDVISIDQGVYGQVISFIDGTHTAIEYDGTVTTLRPDQTITKVEDDYIYDVDACEIENPVIYFDQMALQALRAYSDKASI